MTDGVASDGDELIAAEGYAVGSIEALGSGPGFRQVRQGLGVTTFEVNAVVRVPEGEDTVRRAFQTPGGPADPAA